MNEPLDEDMNSVLGDLDLDLIKDLERQNVEEIKQLRAHERLEIKIDLLVHSANSSSLQAPVKGTTCDLSQGGLMAVFEKPVGVGDVYRIEFGKGPVDLPVVFARCLRCRLLREDAFEAGFNFFNEIRLGHSKKKNDLLG